MCTILHEKKSAICLPVANGDLTSKSKGEDECNDGEIFTSISHGFNFASRRTSKPNSSYPQ